MEINTSDQIAKWKLFVSSFDDYIFS